MRAASAGGEICVCNAGTFKIKTAHLYYLTYNYVKIVRPNLRKKTTYSNVFIFPYVDFERAYVTMYDAHAT
jgi:hypothetical protein